MSFFTADSTSQLALNDPGAEFLLVNNDTVNPIYVSQTKPVNLQSNKIQPQASVTLTGLWYVSTLNTSITVECYIFPGGTTWANPVGVQIALSALGLATLAQQIAQQTAIPNNIAVTGAPPLVFKNVIDLQAGTSIGAGATLTRPGSGQFSINQPGYELMLNVGTLGGTAPIVSVELQWFDSFTGGLIDSELYYFYSGNVNGHQIHGRGPTKGDRLVVIVKNFSGASGVSFSYTLLQTSRTFTREFWKTIGKGGVQPVYPGFTAAASDISANLLAGDSHSLLLNSNISVVLPLYTGSVRLFGTTSDATIGNSRWFITPTTDQVAGSLATFEGANGESGFGPLGPTSLYAADIPLPRSQCQLLLSNTNTTTTETLTAVVTAKEDRA